LVKLIDTHSHLNDEYFINSREAIIASLDCDNISKVFVVGYDLESSIEAINLSLKHKNVYAIIGMHPEHANAYNAEFEAFIEKKDSVIIPEELESIEEKEETSEVKIAPLEELEDKDLESEEKLEKKKAIHKNN